jgi:hypothetical protein
MISGIGLGILETFQLIARYYHTLKGPFGLRAYSQMDYIIFWGGAGGKLGRF